MLELVTIPIDRIVVERREVPVEIHLKEEVLKIERDIEIC